MNNLPTAHCRLPTAARRGFTLIELMIVIVIIAVLASILIPAVNAVLTRSRLAVVTSEMSSIETSIADFESKFGKQPPSYISFVPDASGNLPAPTLAVLRSMFPEIKFNAALQTSLTTAGVWNKELYGPEALVFFLGGVRRVDTASGTYTNELLGFSKNPSNPFAQPQSAGATRIGPFFEFDASRLGEVTRNAQGVYQQTNTDPSSFAGLPLVYLDGLEGQTNPIMYVSTSATNSYSPKDSGLFPNTDPPPSPLPWTPYQKSADSPYNPKSFQLISPGYDGNYGDGGIYNEDETAALAPGDRDNLTNFYSGQLGG